MTFMASQGELTCDKLDVDPKDMLGVRLATDREHFGWVLKNPNHLDNSNDFLEAAASYMESVVTFYFDSCIDRRDYTVGNPVDTILTELALVTPDYMPNKNDHNTIKQIYNNYLTDEVSAELIALQQPEEPRAFASTLITMIDRKRPN